MSTTVQGHRAMLNLPGYHSTAAIVAEVRDGGRGGGYAFATLQISDCQRSVSLEFNVNEPDEFENNLYKIDTILESMRVFRRAVVKQQKLVEKSS